MSWLELILKYFPVVLALIKEVQTQLPHASGTSKQALVAGVISPPEAELPMLNTLISSVVTSSQAAGIMTKDSPVVGGAPKS
jgi:hypothetical protein